MLSVHGKIMYKHYDEPACGGQAFCTYATYNSLKFVILKEVKDLTLANSLCLFE